MTSDLGVAPAPADEPYLLGTDAAEGRRLEAQHRVWASDTGDLWDRARFEPGTRLLDLGCGPGFAAIDLARRVGAGGGVLAVDESAPCLRKSLNTSSVASAGPRVTTVRRMSPVRNRW